jgi:succinate dehydrogenase/fumarate reductase cytochrome b subunit
MDQADGISSRVVANKRLPAPRPCMDLHQFQTMESVCILLHRAAGVGMCSVLYAVHVLLLVTFSFREEWWSYDCVLKV